MKCNLFLIILLYYIYFIVKGEPLIENPIEIMETNYSLVFDINSSTCNIITLGTISVINKLDGAGIKNIFFNASIPPLAIIKNSSTEHYLLVANDFYKLCLNQNGQIESLSKEKIITQKFQMKTLFDYGKNSFGFFPEKGVPVEPHITIKKRFEKNYNEIVLYDTYDNRIVYFYFFNEDIYYDAYNYNFNSIEKHISCILVNTSEYACEYRQNNILQLGTFIFQYKNESGHKEIISNYRTNLSEDINHDFAVIKDNSENNREKIICIREKNDNNYFVFCHTLTITIQEIINDLPESSIEYNTSSEFKNLTDYYEWLSFNMDNCYFTGFYKEYLFCCGKSNIITCLRLDKCFSLINKFDFNKDGNNKNVTILNNNNDYASLFFINEKGEESKLYEYLIDPPKCQNISFELNVSQAFKKDLKEFFDRKENIKNCL